ncbi:MAG: HAMP domain-containing protein, partial [Chloroflexi bacterium]
MKKESVGWPSRISVCPGLRLTSSTRLARNSRSRLEHFANSGTWASRSTFGSGTFETVTPAYADGTTATVRGGDNRRDCDCKAPRKLSFPAQRRTQAPRSMIGAVGRVRLSLRAKIVGPFVLIVALVGTIGTAAVTALVTSEAVAEFNSSLLRASLLANDHLSLVEAARLTTLRAAAATTGVPEATTAKDTATLARLLTPVVGNAAVPSLLLHVLDRQGKEVIVLGPDGPVATQSPSDSFVSEPAVASVLAGRSDAQGDKYVFLKTDPAGTTLYWTGPIRSLTGQVTGVAMVGEPLLAIAAGIRSSGAADVTFYGSGGGVLLSSLSATGALPAATLSMVQPDRPVRFGQSSGGEAYMNLVSDWTMRKMRLGYLAVALNTAQLQAGLDQLRLFLLILFAAAAVITLMIGLALAGAITRPVQRLVGAMGAVAAGDLAQRAPAGPSDEIGYLGKVFNLMTAGL